MTSPTNEFAPKERSNSGDEVLDKKETSGSGGSILGLRSSKFTNLEKKTSPSPEAKPRQTTTTTTEESSPTNFGPKPKPLPKPRPWSIVGVDRKSGEMTSVTNSESNQNKAEKPTSVRDMINKVNQGSGEAKRKVSSLPRGSQPPSGESSTNTSANSPKLSKKTDSTSDDPRILKLEDDYAYEGVMDV